MVHDTFPRETVQKLIIRMSEENEYDSTYLSFYSIDTATSQSLQPPSKYCESLRTKILLK